MKKLFLIAALTSASLVSACSNASENGAETGIDKGNDATSSVDPVVPVDNNPDAKAQATPEVSQPPTSPGNPAGAMNMPATPEHSSGAQQKSSQ